MPLEDGADDALNIAGYWTVGVLKGFMVVVVPIAVVSLATGCSIFIANMFGFDLWSRGVGKGGD